jgi:hypothetical protein
MVPFFIFSMFKLLTLVHPLPSQVHFVLDKTTERASLLDRWQGRQVKASRFASLKDYDPSQPLTVLDEANPRGHFLANPLVAFETPSPSAASPVAQPQLNHPVLSTHSPSVSVLHVDRARVRRERNTPSTTPPSSSDEQSSQQ